MLPLPRVTSVTANAKLLVLAHLSPFDNEDSTALSKLLALLGHRTEGILTTPTTFKGPTRVACTAAILHGGHPDLTQTPTTKTTTRHTTKKASGVPFFDETRKKMSTTVSPQHSNNKRKRRPLRRNSKVSTTVSPQHLPHASGLLQKRDLPKKEVEIVVRHKFTPRPILPALQKATIDE